MFSHFLKRTIVALGLLLPHLASGQGVATERVYLSGTDKNNTVPWDFRVSGGRQAGVWTTIPVPSCWEMKGFGTYTYGNWSAGDEYGDYRKNFTVPANWAGRRVFLVYEGSMAETETTVNGIPAGSNGATITTTPLTNDRAIDNSSSVYGSPGGMARSSAANLALGTRAAFTMTGWIKPGTASVLTTGFPRIMMVGDAAGYDGGSGQGAYFAVFNNTAPAVSSALQFKINTDTGNGALSASGVLNGTDWIFVAVTYDSALANNQVKMYAGQRLVPLTAPVATATYGANAQVNFGPTASAYFLNRNSGAGRTRAFSGLGDDFRIYDGALSAATLDAVRASAVSATNVSPTTNLLYQWNFNTAGSGTTALPQTGAGGDLTLRNAADVATDLYSPVGGGVSGAPGSLVPTIHRGGFYEFSHEITNQITVGASNLLEVTVRKTTSDTTINDAERKGDYWNFGGIYRPVYLESRPAANIERIAVNPLANGNLTVNAFLTGNTTASTVTARVTTLADVQIGSDFLTAAAANAASVSFSSVIPGVQPWSPEFPNLYKLIVELRDTASGTLTHTLTETIGFRTIQVVTGEGFYLNGKRTKLRGTVHHEFWPDTGRTSSRQQSIDDILLMKGMNMNAVRRAHYPATRAFYEEADRLGIMVLDELGGWQHAYGDTAGHALCRELVIRDVNHPCVIAWDNGNESGWNTNVDGDYSLWDPQNRTVLHPATYDHLFGGFKTHHYSNYALIQSTYLGAGRAAFMPTENLHGLFDGGAGAGLYDYWEAIRTAPNGAGLFIWAFLDEALKRDDYGGALDTVGDAACDGILGPYREKEASYFTAKALFSPVQITSQLASGNPVLAIENRYDFTNTNQCTFRWKLGWFPDPADPTSALDSGMLTQVDSGNLTGPAIAPATSGNFTLGLPADFARYDLVRLTATGPDGREIYTWTWPLHAPATIDTRVVPPTATGPAVTADTSSPTEIVVTAGTRVFRFSKSNGQLLGVTSGGLAVSIANGPRPVSGTWTVASVTSGFVGGEYRVTLNDPDNSTDAFEWRIRADGWLRLKYRYTLTGQQSWLGVTFDYPEANVTAMRWLGQGPYRVWKNRLAGQETGVYRKLANNTNTGQQWGYPEFRGYHGKLNWATLETTQLPITIVSGTPDLFFRVLSWPDGYASRPGVNVPRPSGNLSLLHGINPIGHKFGDSASLGPQGEPNTATGLYTGAADFFFGILPAPAVDRDADGLIDYWELSKLNSLSMTGKDDPAGDGLPLLIKNAFDLAPLPPDANNDIRLPKLVPGTTSPVALTYRVPVGQLDHFTFIPEISRDLQTWYQATQPTPFLVLAETTSAGDRIYTAEPSADWPAPNDKVFMRVNVGSK